MPLPKYIVRLTAAERTALDDLIGPGKRAASVLLHARILLKAAASAGGPDWDEVRIAEAVECGASTVYRVRRAFVTEGLTAALVRKKPTGRQYRKLDGAQEAHLLALGCGAPPAGRTHWTLRLLADRLVELAVLDSISPECVRMTLKKPTQAVVAPTVGHPAGGECGLRLRPGRRAGGVYPAARSSPAGGLSGRGQQTPCRGHPHALAGGTGPASAGGLRIRTVRDGELISDV